jgi:Holliday junction DNA helicase RuvA
MIAFLRGTVIDEAADNIVLEAGSVGYQVMLPAHQMKVLRALHGVGNGTAPGGAELRGAEIALHIYYHASERQPVPVLVGFHEVKEKEFFELLISVAGLGPMAVAKAMTVPVSEFASRIQTRDIRALSELPGIGRRKAEQIIATLWGKVFEYALLPAVEVAEAATAVVPDFEADTRAVLEQLGYRPAEAEQMIRDAKARTPEADTVQSLLETIWAAQQRS